MHSQDLIQSQQPFGGNAVVGNRIVNCVQPLADLHLDHRSHIGESRPVPTPCRQSLKLDRKETELLRSQEQLDIV